MKVHDIVQAAAEAWPDATAVADERGRITYAELAAEVDTLAASLTAAGVGPGQGIGLVARNGCGFVVGLFAALKTGAVVMPISHQLASAEVATLLTECPLAWMLDDGSTAFDVGGPREAKVAGRHTLHLARTRAPADQPLAPHLPDAAFVRFTSGTTGKSKGVVIGHQGVLARTEAAHEALGLDAGDTVVWVLPMAYHFVVSVVMYVRYGIQIAVSPDILAASILACTNEHAGTLLYAAPTHYRMLAADTSGVGVPTLTRAVSTSSAIPRDVAEAFHARFGLPISQVYGIIEIGIPAGNLEHGADHPDAIGRAMPGYTIGILDDAGNEVADGQVGRLAMKGPGMFDGYLSPPQTRDDVLDDGWFHTGDLAKRTADGLVEIAGREKSMINTAGLKVFPEEVEAVLDAHEGVAQSRVYGVAHPVMGEVVAAEVVPVDGATLDPTDLRRWCRARLTNYKTPQRIEVVEAVAMTRTGKVARG